MTTSDSDELPCICKIGEEHPECPEHQRLRALDAAQSAQDSDEAEDKPAITETSS